MQLPRLAFGHLAQDGCTKEDAQGATVDVAITVVDGDISGSAFFCGPLDVEGFPWYAYSDTSLSNQGIPGSASPADADALDLVSGVVDEVLVTLYGVTTVCEGYIPVDFGNGTSDVTDPSFFDFDAGIVGTGGCAVDGGLLDLSPS